MNEKILNEIENNRYLIINQENEISDLKNSIKKYERFLLISIYTIFPLAIIGLLYLIKIIDVKFTLLSIIIIISSLGLLYLLGLLVQKIKK